MVDTPLPFGRGKDFSDRFDEPRTIVRDYETDTIQAAAPEITQKRQPVLSVLFRGFGYALDIAISVLIDASSTDGLTALVS